VSAAEVQTKKTAFEVTSLEVLEPYPQHEGLLRLRVRSALGIQSFGVNAYGTTEPGVTVIGEHDETAPWSNGQEELYVVVAGHATFTVDGEEIDAPAGTLVFVSDRNARRGAVGLEAGTRVLAIGGTPGAPYRISAGEAAQAWYPHYEAKEFEQALGVLEATFADYPGNAFLLYNTACCESLLGRRDDALEHLRLAVEGHPAFLENARDDADLDPIRDDPRYAGLFG
jgi:tetratricopeptide (TPR) repeat protein